jgi:uncharacterized membrane protein
MSDEQASTQQGFARAPDEGVIAWTHVIYGLHAFSVLTGMLTAVTVVGAFLFGWPSIIGVILNYLKAGDARGSWVESHFRWQIRTFWFALVWLGVAAVFFFTVIGIPVAIVLAVGLTLWIAYRVIRGWLALVAGKPMPSAKENGQK